MPIGTVSFFDVFNGVKSLLGMVAVNPTTGMAKLTTSALSVGTHTIRAKYNPAVGSDFLPS